MTYSLDRNYFIAMLQASKLPTRAILLRHLEEIPDPSNCASLDSYWLRLSQISKMPLGDFKAVEGMQAFVLHTWAQGRELALTRREEQLRRNARVTRKAQKMLDGTTKKRRWTK